MCFRTNDSAYVPRGIRSGSSRTAHNTRSSIFHLSLPYAASPPAAPLFPALYTSRVLTTSQTVSADRTEHRLVSFQRSRTWNIPCVHELPLGALATAEHDARTEPSGLQVLLLPLGPPRRPSVLRPTRRTNHVRRRVWRSGRLYRIGTSMPTPTQSGRRPVAPRAARCDVSVVRVDLVEGVSGDS